MTNKSIMDEFKEQFEFDTTTTGTLTVENNKSIDEPKQPKKKVVKLPAIGDKFMLNGQEYIVCYINEGKQRFSCEPCDGIY